MESRPGAPRLEGATRVILWVQDFDAALDFYRDVLGLSLAYPAGGGWAEFQTAGPALCLHEGRAHDHPTRHVASFGWRVEDLDGAVAWLASHGVEVSRPHRISETLRSVDFADPSGNALFFEGP
jgi:catechol 2,3-dioxygenase-like lactoylglutathione lyase family enzyme